jgi:hypothetical protein
MPHLARGIHHHAKHWHHQLRSTPRNRLQHSNVAGNELRSVQRHLPTLPPRHPRLLANIRHHARKFVHPHTFISDPLPRRGADGNCSIATEAATNTPPIFIG